MAKPNMPIDCRAFGRVAEINGMLHVGRFHRMFQLKEGAWKGENQDLGFDIESVFECEGKGYVMDRATNFTCKTLYEWKSETRYLETLIKIPLQCQLEYRSAIGHKRKIYLVGGDESDRVDCFDINRREWEPIKKMKNRRTWCSLAVIEDKMFVGGGTGEGKSVECFSMEKQDWIDIKATTKERCELSSWNGKLVATGGWEEVYKKSKCVELYDELSGDWLPLPSMNEGREGHGTCATKDDKLIVVGGWGTEYSVESLQM